MLLLRYDFSAGRKHACFERSQRLPIQSEQWRILNDRRNFEICSKLTLKTLKQNQLTSLRYLLAFIRLRSRRWKCSIKKVILKFRNIHKKTTVLESLFNKVTGFRAYDFIKRYSNTCFSCECCQIFKNIYFEKYLPPAASVDCIKFYRATKSQIELYKQKLKFIFYLLFILFNLS